MDTRSDLIFKREIALSQRWTEHVHQLLSQDGVQSQVPPVTVRPERSQWRAYSDHGDLIIDDETILEVKSRRIRFGWEPSSYPYPTAFIDTAGVYDAKQHHPAAIILVSRPTGACLVASVRRTRHLWVARESYDCLRNETRWRYELDREHLTDFRSLTDWLLEKQAWG